MTSPFTAAATTVADAVRATFVAVWPRSVVRNEIARLCEEGHAEGETCEMAFSVCFDDDHMPGDAAMAIRRAGYDLEATQASRGFLTARTSLRLRPMDLARSVTRLERAVRASGGFVAVIGPTDSTPMATTPVPASTPRPITGSHRGVSAVA